MLIATFGAGVPSQKISVPPPEPVVMVPVVRIRLELTSRYEFDGMTQAPENAAVLEMELLKFSFKFVAANVAGSDHVVPRHVSVGRMAPDHEYPTYRSLLDIPEYCI